jgi:nitrate/TMAO reductase-like tetraheme cytochrome c subunit
MPTRSLSRNLISQAGVVLAVVALANTAFLIVVDAAQAHSNPYMGILAWIVAPAILGAGLALYIIGIFVERRRRLRQAPEEIPQYPVVDFNERRTRTIVVATAVGIILFVVASVIGSYHAYHYTETNAFCGSVCHQVMGPEYTAYKRSPHARVGCVDCHVGTGAAWYLRSKASGTHQLYVLVTKSYTRPIPTPVSSMRPAQQTCEQCHWPERFFGTQLKTFDHFAYDEANTPRQVQMLIKTGGGSPGGGLTAGIHWHMNIASEVTYMATDPHRQQIPWVRVKDRSGHVTEYLLEGSKLTAAQIAASPKRRMDCIDCHSRPTHIYVSPDRAVDRALLAGSIDRTLPYVKQQAVAIVAKDYPSTPAAVRAIAADLSGYYQKTYPAVYSAKKAAIEGAVTAVQQIFSTTRFPEMRVDWRTHPDNIGHFTSMGCFRCHDDQHVSSDGKRLSKDCQICHTVLSAGQSNAQFEHPVDLGDLRSVNCSDCHTGGSM